ncbi:MAG: hypothetical protein FD143_184 [Ignavibacteria bacterium]|nr:MAG: hypothetical protein FD143_184 [Ignavibacteria bacterium]KAF0162402.1 MAG: hypothetical protein FD188_5 [Ignavibacteria bacterium]
MLLETLDLRRNDVLIYSQNKFNFNDNFKIIYKNEKVKRVRSISYFDVCSFVKDPSPKNLIVYRLLTNVNHLDAYSTKYGYFININGRVELVYFDPVFAIKDLRHLRFDLDPEQFRFKIQQTGLTTLNKKNAEPAQPKYGEQNKPPEASFNEVYSFDLKAFEAQNQNDKIFAEAIFAFDEVLSEEEYLETSAKKHDGSLNDSNTEKKFEIIESLEIAEDKHASKQNLNRLASPSPEKINDIREEIVDLLKQALGINESLKSRHHAQVKSNIEMNPQTEEANLLDLFKTTGKSEQLPSDTRDTVVLKFGSSR